MSVERSRIALLTGLATLVIRGSTFTAWADAPPAATVYKGAT